jgi:hypothetical protein
MSEGVAIVRVDAVEAVDSGGAARRRECERCDSLVSLSDSSDERLVVGEFGNSDRLADNDEDDDEAKANAAAAEEEAVDRVARLMMDGGRTKPAVGADASDAGGGGLAEGGAGGSHVEESAGAAGADNASTGAATFPAVLGKASAESIERCMLHTADR